MPKRASNAKITPYLLELQESANHAILIIITAPHVEQLQTASPVSPTFIFLTEFANNVVRMSQDASHAKRHQQKPLALGVWSPSIWTRIKLVSPVLRLTLTVIYALLKIDAINA